MSTTVIDITSSQTGLAELLALIEAGDEVILSRNDQPIARLLPLRSKHQKKRVLGLHQGAVEIQDSFDDPF